MRQDILCQESLRGMESSNRRARVARIICRLFCNSSLAIRFVVLGCFALCFLGYLSLVDALCWGDWGVNARFVVDSA